MSDGPFDSGFDPELEDLRAPMTDDEIVGQDLSSFVRAHEIAVIRTSDRVTFKGCRRRWGWGSHLKYNLGAIEPVHYFWFGTGMHYALEDFHGYNIYGSPTSAFLAYCYATHANRERVPVPPSFHELKELGIGMMQYYELWLTERDPLKTLWVDGVPQVEVKARLELPWDPRAYYPTSPFKKAVYQVTIDRVVEDSDGLLWLVDYKSAKQIQTMHFLTDPQIGAYYWAGSHIYKRPIAGFIYQQHRKDVPEDPRITALGRLSTDKRQLTTHRAYRRVCGNIFGANPEKWPKENIHFLNNLALEETPEADKFIRRDRVYRNAHSHETEGAKILLELEDMLNPDLPLYPNPTRMGCLTCPFLHACVSMDDGSDFQYELDIQHAPKQTEDLSWRQALPDPLHPSLSPSSLPTPTQAAEMQPPPPLIQW